MYTDNRNGRVLLKDGTSVLSSFGYARHVLNGTLPEQAKVLEDYDSLVYDQLNNTKVSIQVNEEDPLPPEHTHTDEQLDYLLQLIVSSPRYQDTDEFNERIEVEIEYFDRSENIIFILKCYDLIQEFKKKGIVWGVGRGSSCASLVCFLLEINDINPLVFDIQFSELSKE